jgi:hypothetical protein
MFTRLALVLALSVGFALMVAGAKAWGASHPLPQTVAALRLGECALPCWVGIVPGVTRMEEVQGLVSSTGARGSFRITGSVSPQGNQIGDYRLRRDEQSNAFISIAFSDGRVNQVMILANGITLGDLILAYGIPSCQSSIWDLYYDTPQGRATLVFDSAVSRRYTVTPRMILLQRPQAQNAEQSCISDVRESQRWHGIAPAWRYEQLAANS